nr:hypothetical protein CPGR_01463 [Mycolicibacterium komanii]
MESFVAMVAAAGVLVVTAPPSHGQPGDEGAAAEPPVVPLTVSLADLGVPSPLAFYGEVSSQKVTLPIPRGLTPTAINAGVELPINLQSGSLTVMQGERTLGRVDLAPSDQPPVEIPLAGAEVINDSVSVTLYSYLLPLDRLCFRAESPLRLVNGVVSYTGVEQPPDTVAQFLPPVLRKLSVFLPQSPSLAESEAAIQLASSVIAQYGSQRPEVSIVPLNSGQTVPPGPSQPQERQVVIKEGPNAGLTLQGAPDAPWLLISGPLGQAGKEEIALLFSDLSQVALSKKAAVDSLSINRQFPGSTATLRELAQPFFNATSLEPQVSIAIDQTRFGRPIHDVRIGLKGSYSPVPSDAGGQIVVSVGDEVIDRWAADGQGKIDRSVTVPDRLLQRYTTVRVTLNDSENAGRCGDFYSAGPEDRQLSLTIDGDTVVQSKPAAPPVPGGFQSMPQALMPHVQVGIKAGSFADTVRAADILVGLQRRTSATPLDVTVSSVEQAIQSSGPAIVIAADGWKNSDVVLPVSAADTGPITFNGIDIAGKPATLTLDPTLRFGSLQTVFNNGRSILVATSNGAADQLDALLRYLSVDQRWQNLRGVAAVSVAGHDPVAIDLESPPAADPVASTKNLTDKVSPKWLAAGLLVILGAGLAIAIYRRRGRRRVRVSRH